MDDVQNQLQRQNDQRPSPWKLTSLPKFADIPGRKFSSRPNAKTVEGEPLTPPVSPMGVIKYPALLSCGDACIRTSAADAIIRELNRGIVNEVTKPSKTARIYDVDKEEKAAQMMPDSLFDKKPTSGETKLCLWQNQSSKNYPRHDLSTLQERESAGEIEDSSNVSVTSDQKKSKKRDKAGGRKKVLNEGTTAEEFNPQQKNSFGTMWTNDFELILRHAISHDPIIAKPNLLPSIQRSLIFPNRNTRERCICSKMMSFMDRKFIQK